MVNLTRIYTRTGDAGQTRLGDMSITSKNDPRLRAYADVDEAGAHIGVALTAGGLDDDVVRLLRTVQNDLFDVGADLCTPVVEEPEFPPLRIEQDYVDRLQGWCHEENKHPPNRLAWPGWGAGATGKASAFRSCGRSSSTPAAPARRTSTTPAG